jgi:hypothetical protein
MFFNIWLASAVLFLILFAIAFCIINKSITQEQRISISNRKVYVEDALLAFLKIIVMAFFPIVNTILAIVFLFEFQELIEETIREIDRKY